MMRLFALILLALLLGCGARTGLSIAGSDGGPDQDSEPTDDAEVSPEDSGLPRSQGLSLGTWLSCAVEAGVASCWGINQNGQIGDGTRDDRWEPAVALVPADVVAVAAGQWHACALDATGAVWCWGQVGNWTWMPSPEPIGVEDAVALASGAASACAVLQDGAVTCWGSTWQRRGGVCEMASATGPVRVSGASRAIAVAVGNGHQCLIRDDRRLYCWGCNTHGKLGIGTEESPETPTRVPGLEDVIEVSLGYEHSCALLEGGRVYCWGDNSTAQLGDGTREDQGLPVPFLGVSDAVDVAAGGPFSTCVVHRDGTITCAGAQITECSGGACSGTSDPPVWNVAGLSDVEALRIGNWHYCVRHRGSALSCWGDNFFGQVGDGTNTFRPEPVAVHGW